jgi:hypothetical protein
MPKNLRDPKATCLHILPSHHMNVITTHARRQRSPLRLWPSVRPSPEPVFRYHSVTTTSFFFYDLCLIFKSLLFSLVSSQTLFCAGTCTGWADTPKALVRPKPPRLERRRESTLSPELSQSSGQQLRTYSCRCRSCI